MLRTIGMMVLVAFMAFSTSVGVTLLHKYFQSRHIEQVRR